MSKPKSQRSYHVCGLGNALVDTAMNGITDPLLKTLNIAKGVMTLIDEKTALDLAIDLHDYPHVRACGGSAANTMIALSQLGGTGFYACRVANDPNGLFYLDALSEAGIDYAIDKTDLPNGTTGRCFVLITPDAQRTMCTHLGISADFSEADLTLSVIAESEFLYIEGYLAAQTQGTKAAIKAYQTAKEHNTQIAITLSDPNMVTYCKANLIDMIGNGVDWLFCNDEEALLFTETDSLDRAIDILRLYSKQGVITCGAEGALVYDNHTSTHVPGHKVTAIDTLGAGDMFAGAFLYGITHHHSPITAAKLANYAASCVVTKVGPRLEGDEVLQLQRYMENVIALAPPELLK